MKAKTEKEGCDSTMAKFSERFETLFIETVQDNPISIEKFGKQNGLSRQTCQNYLNGGDEYKNRLPDGKTLITLAQNFNVTTDWLLGLTDTRTVDTDFASACKTLGLSEKAAKALAENQGPILSDLLEHIDLASILYYYGRAMSNAKIVYTAFYDEKDKSRNPSSGDSLSPADTARFYFHRSAEIFENGLKDEFDKKVDRIKEIRDTTYEPRIAEDAVNYDQNPEDDDQK